jgi:hypothetical protein
MLSNISKRHLRYVLAKNGKPISKMMVKRVFSGENALFLYKMPAHVKTKQKREIYVYCDKY